MKKIHLAIIIALVVIVDQALKLYIKTHIRLNTAHTIAGNWIELYFVIYPGMAFG